MSVCKGKGLDKCECVQRGYVHVCEVSLVLFYHILLVCFNRDMLIVFISPQELSLTV